MKSTRTEFGSRGHKKFSRFGSIARKRWSNSYKTISIYTCIVPQDTQARNMAIGTVAYKISKYKDLYGEKTIVSLAYECKRIYQKSVNLP